MRQKMKLKFALQFLGLTVFLVLIPSLTSCALLQPQRPDRYAGLRPAERRLAMAIDRRDLVLGMTREHVREVWGSPYDVETAGSSWDGNERWTYMGRLLNPAFRGMGEERVVYFENGRVVGWDKN